MKVQTVTPYRVSHLQRYGVTVRGNVTSVYPPLDRGVLGPTAKDHNQILGYTLFDRIHSTLLEING
jgi:hypothetical protein